MRIGLDLDGCLADWNTAFADLIIGVTGVNRFGDYLPPDQEAFHTWHWPTAYGYSVQQIENAWKAVKQHPDFWYRLAPLPGMTALTRRLDQLEDHDVYFITNRMGRDVKRQSEDWLTTREIYNPTVLITPHKGSVAAALDLDCYLDDYIGNVASVKDLSPCTRGYLLSAPWNRKQRPLGMRVVPDVETFFDLEGLNGR